MPQTITHAAVHAAWSHAQLAAFRNMTPQARLDAVKTGTLEHWAPDDRDTALDLVANAPPPPERAAHATSRRFEPATAALPPITLRPPRFDRMIAVAAVGWLLIACALTGHAYRLY